MSEILCYEDFLGNDLLMAPYATLHNTHMEHTHSIGSFKIQNTEYTCFSIDFFSPLSIHEYHQQSFYESHSHTHNHYKFIVLSLVCFYRAKTRSLNIIIYLQWLWHWNAQCSRMVKLIHAKLTNNLCHFFLVLHQWRHFIYYYYYRHSIKTNRFWMPKRRKHLYSHLQAVYGIIMGALCVC